MSLNDEADIFAPVSILSIRKKSGRGVCHGHVALPDTDSLTAGSEVNSLEDILQYFEETAEGTGTQFFFCNRHGFNLLMPPALQQRPLLRPVGTLTG